MHVLCNKIQKNVHVLCNKIKRSVHVLFNKIQECARTVFVSSLSTISLLYIHWNLYYCKRKPKCLTISLEIKHIIKQKIMKVNGWLYLNLQYYISYLIHTDSTTLYSITLRSLSTLIHSNYQATKASKINAIVWKVILIFCANFSLLVDINQGYTRFG